jgi:hypothetical protein
VHRTRRGLIHNKVDSPELLDAAIDGILQIIVLAHINRANADDLGSWPSGGNVLGCLFGLLDVSADDACVRA